MQGLTGMSVTLLSCPESALGQLETVQARLAQNERDLQAEIDALREELRKDQDPSRMQLIQEMISVSWSGTFSICLVCGR